MGDGKQKWEEPWDEQLRKDLSIRADRHTVHVTADFASGSGARSENAERCNNHILWFCYHDGDVVSPMTGQGAIQFKKSMLGLQEAAEVVAVQRHHHGDVVHTAQ